MTQSKNINRNSVLDVTPTGSPISQKSGLQESAVSGRATSPKYPLVISTPSFAPVVMGPCGFWSKALIETMYAAAKPPAPVRTAPDRTDQSRTVDGPSDAQSRTGDGFSKSEEQALEMA